MKLANNCTTEELSVHPHRYHRGYRDIGASQRGDRFWHARCSTAPHLFDEVAELWRQVGGAHDASRHHRLQSFRLVRSQLERIRSRLGVAGGGWLWKTVKAKQEDWR